jgi:sirohydrochlorin cobaltochelatase
VSKVARLLWEGLGLGWCEVGLFRRDLPLVEPCLTPCGAAGYRRVVVFPYFLFSGVLVDRIYGFTDRVAAAHPGIEWVKAGYLGLHPEVLRTFAERATEQVEGVPPPNCQMCKYRTQVLGFEAEVGSAAGEPPSPCRGAGGVRAGVERGGLHALRRLLHGALPAEGRGRAGVVAGALGGGHVHSHGTGRSMSRAGRASP